MSNEILDSDGSFSLSDTVNRVKIIQTIMNSVMIEGVHYGEIEGFGKKNTLLKAGAEKIMTAFKLVATYEIERIQNGRHREYAITCFIKSEKGELLGQGMGSCSTEESRYKYRTKKTEKLVPKEYWDTRDSSLLGGSQFSARNYDGKWVIVEKVEHQDPADYYNTVLKMAKKSAMIDAVISVTAASDMFSQDIEDLPTPEEIEKIQPKIERSSGINSFPLEQEDLENKGYKKALIEEVFGNEVILKREGKKAKAMADDQLAEKASKLIGEEKFVKISKEGNKIKLLDIK